MRPGEVVRSVLLDLRMNKSRVFMTSLGIVIGTFTIIMVVGIGKAGQQAVADQYKRLSAESITITQNSMGGGFRPGQTTTATAATVMTYDQMMQMPDLLTRCRSRRPTHQPSGRSASPSRAPRPWCGGSRCPATCPSPA